MPSPILAPWESPGEEADLTTGEGVEVALDAIVVDEDGGGVEVEDKELDVVEVEAEELDGVLFAGTEVKTVDDAGETVIVDEMDVVDDTPAGVDTALLTMKIPCLS